MCKYIKANIFIILLSGLWSFTAVSAEEQVILEVIVNGHNAGQHFLILSTDNDVLVSPDFLTELRLRGELWKDNGKDPVSLRSLASALQFQVDHNNAVLTLAVTPESFVPQIVSRPEPKKALARDDTLSSLPFAAFVNYQLQANYTEEKGFGSYNLPWEIGINRGKWLAFSTFQTIRSDEGTDTSRLMTNLIRDDPKNLHRLTLGDFNAGSTNLLGGGMFGGISWETRFSLDRDFKAYPGMNVETMLESPTHAELLSNGHIVREWDLLPGPVNFNDLDAYGGDELMLRDVYGRERLLSLPSLFRGQSLLNTGVHEFSYNLGFVRENFGEDDNSYGDITASGFHRYGLNDRFSPGFAFALQKELINIGFMTAMRLGNHNLSNIETLYSHSNGEDGYALSLNHSLRWHNFSGHLSLRQYSRDFTTLSNGQQSTSVRYQGSLSLNHNWQEWGGLSLGYSDSSYWEEMNDPSALMTLTYKKNLFKHLSMSVSVRRAVRGPENDEVFLSLNYIPSDKREKMLYNSVGYRFLDTETDNSEHELRIQKNAGMGKGFGYNLVINQEENETGGSIRSEYRDELAILTATCQRPPGGSTGGSLSMAGGIGFLDKGFYLGRPVIDSFAVVEMEGLDNVPIYHNNSLAGVVSSGDTLLVPTLPSYQESQISIRPKDLPINFEFVDKNKYVKIGQRGGALVTFKAFKFSAVEGNLYLALPDGGREPLSALPVEIEVAGEKRTTFIGQDGYFYLENLPTGDHVLRVLRFGGDCEALLTVPESDKIVGNLGEVPCEPVTEP